MKNKILKLDFLIVGSGLIGSLLALALMKKNFTVLVIEKNKITKRTYSDQRTLAVNANSRDFLKSIDIWSKIKRKPVKISKISIKTFHNEEELIFEDNIESMGSVIYNQELLAIAHKKLIRTKLLIDDTDLNISELNESKIVLIKNKQYSFKKIIVLHMSSHKLLSYLNALQ